MSLIHYNCTVCDKDVWTDDQSWPLKCCDDIMIRLLDRLTPSKLFAEELKKLECSCLGQEDCGTCRLIPWSQVDLTPQERSRVNQIWGKSDSLSGRFSDWTKHDFSQRATTPPNPFRGRELYRTPPRREMCKYCDLPTENGQCLFCCLAPNHVVKLSELDKFMDAVGSSEFNANIKACLSQETNGRYKMIIVDSLQ